MARKNANGHANGQVKNQPKTDPNTTLIPISELAKAELGPLGERVKQALTDFNARVTQLETTTKSIEAEAALKIRVHLAGLRNQAKIAETVYVNLQQEFDSKVVHQAEMHGVKSPQWSFSTDSMAFAVANVDAKAQTH